MDQNRPLATFAFAVLIALGSLMDADAKDPAGAPVRNSFAQQLLGAWRIDIPKTLKSMGPDQAKNKAEAKVRLAQLKARAGEKKE